MHWVLNVAAVLGVGLTTLAMLIMAPNSRPEPQPRAFTLYVRGGWVPLPDGSQIHVWGFTDDPNGSPQVPGPAIVVNEGDTVEITLINDRDPTASDRLPAGEGHTIHLHGLDVLTEHDGVPETHPAGLVRQGGTFTYRFVAQHAGTYFYHCHQNNVEHQQMGMYGPIVVRAANGAKQAYTGGPAYDHEHTLVLAEMGAEGHEQARRAAQDAAPPYNWLRLKPDYVFLNDRAYPAGTEPWATLEAGPDERVLVRAINAGYVVHALHAHGAPFQVIASDGRPWPGGPTTDTIWLGPGERYDLVVMADAAGRVALHDHANAPYAPARTRATDAPPAAAPSGTTHRFTLYVREGTRTMPDGAELAVLGYADAPDAASQVPGPSLVVTEGDLVEIALVNDRDPTGQGQALALHGPDTPFDGPARVSPGETGVYRFVARSAGSYLYSGLADGSQQLGLYGALVVESAVDARRIYTGGPTFDQQYTLVLSEMDAAGHAQALRARQEGAAPYDWARYAPNYFLINGRAYPDTERHPASMVHAALGERIQLRAINAGQQPHALHLHGYHFHVVAADGRPRPGWPAKDTVLIAPGESYDLLFTADQPGLYPLHDHFETANTNNGVWLGGMHTMVVTGVEHRHAPADPPAHAGAVAASAPAEAAGTVYVRDNFYAPRELTVPVGATVRWAHNGQVEHTVSSLLGQFESGTMLGGEAFAHTFTAPGRYDYFCRFHITNRGTVVVQ